MMHPYDQYLYAVDQLRMAETLRDIYPDDGHYVELVATMRRRLRRACRSCSNHRG